MNGKHDKPQIPEGIHIDGTSASAVAPAQNAAVFCLTPRIWPEFVEYVRETNPSFDGVSDEVIAADLRHAINLLGLVDDIVGKLFSGDSTSLIVTLPKHPT